MGPPKDNDDHPLDRAGDGINVYHGWPIIQTLPVLVVRTLQKHFYAGVKHAEVRFACHAADEDSVAGALAENLIEPEPISIIVDGQLYQWRTFYYKIRGRGANAPIDSVRCSSTSATLPERLSSGQQRTTKMLDASPIQMDFNEDWATGMSPLPVMPPQMPQ